MQPQAIMDGSVSWIGGMDSSRPSYLLEQGYYHRGCNLMISRSSGKLTTRYGFECVKLVGDEDAICIYNNAKNLQAEGSYKENNSIVLLRLVDGWLLEFRFISSNKLNVKLLNREDRRSSHLSKAWITRIPGGAIVNDGLSLPFIVRRGSIRRSDPSNNEIGVGRMGIYVQNRFFYVDSSGKYIFVSDFRKPESVENAKVANVYGFILPEDQGEISAIGIRKQNLNYVDGGILAFSTPFNTYSVDVRGDIQNWEVGNSGLGKVQESLPGIGAISSYSYESFSSDLYFRTLNEGVNNIGYLEDQFNKGVSYTSQSTEVMQWMDRDTKRLLSKCYTRRFGHRLFTTVAPSINKHGYVYWNGMISLMPSPIHNSSRLPDVYEGLWTGVRPLAITSFDDELEGSVMMVDSYDQDGITRMYRLNVKLDHDIDKDFKRKEIKSWLETKSFNFGDIPTVKRITSRSYTVSDIPRNLKVSVRSRKEGVGKWVKFFDTEHLVERVSLGRNEFGLPYLNPVSSSAQERKFINMPQESEGDDVAPGGMSGPFCYSRQYRIEFEGSVSLESIILKGQTDQKNDAVYASENNGKICGQDDNLDYNYLIS